MQKEITKTMGNKKKYGEPYINRHLIRYGEITEIAKKTGYEPISITQQMTGTRKMQEVVRIAADKIVSDRIASIN